MALQVALLPCLIGYGMIARRLYEDSDTMREGSKYWKWIETYVGEDYCKAMEVGRGMLNRLCALAPLIDLRSHRRACYKAISLPHR